MSSRTDENLSLGFTDESETHMRYLAYARQAAEEGYENVAHLFRAVAEAETVHALNHMDALGGVDETVENLKKAVAEEESEMFSLYPEFIKQARKEDRTEAVMSMTWIQQSEKAHFNLFRQALESLERGERDLEEESYFLCENCGFVAVGVAPANCPVCRAPQKMFREIA